MNTFLLFLGQTTELALAELEVVAHRVGLEQPKLIQERVAQLSGETEVVSSLLDIVGGTVKIAELITTLPITASQPEIESTLLDILLETEVKGFVVAEHGRDHLEPINVYALKNQANKAGKKLDFKDTPRYGGSAALLRHRRVLELHIINTPEGILIAKTIAVQDPNDWAFRDIERPHRDRKRGMLQPKVARMLLNLAIGDKDPTQQVVLDPFSGSGTIPVEAIELDLKAAYGSDISAEAVSDTLENLKWYAKETQSDLQFAVLERPVHQLELRDFPLRPTCIATEPFLGKLTPNPEAVPGTVRGLEKLYRGMMRSFARLLEPGGRVAIVLPSFTVGRREVTVNDTLQYAQELGFEVVGGPWRAGRPGATTQRNAYVFEYKKNL